MNLTRIRQTTTDLHIITYLPATGGNFMTRLFSLSDNVKMPWKQGSCGCLPVNSTFEEKWKWLIFKESQVKNWGQEAHLLPFGGNILNDYDIPGGKENKNLVICKHFAGWKLTCNSSFRFTDTNINEHHYYIKVSEENWHFMNRYMHLEISPQEKEDYDWVLSNIDIKPIDLDLMLTGDNGFLSEYKRVCAIMNLGPIPDDKALEFFNNWRYLRVDNPEIDRNMNSG